MTELKTLDELLQPANRRYQRPKTQLTTLAALLVFSGTIFYLNHLFQRLETNSKDTEVIKQIQLIQSLQLQTCQKTEHEINCETHTVIPQSEPNQRTSLSILDANQNLQTTFHWQYHQSNKFLIEINKPKQYFWCTIDNQSLICHNQNKQKSIQKFSLENHTSSLLNIPHESNNRTR